jgi:hypothetical protein
MNIGEQGLRPAVAGAGALIERGEYAFRSGVWRLEKYEDESVQWHVERGLTAQPYEEPLEWPNAYINGGSQVMLDLLIGAAGTPFSNANAYIGVGDSSTAPAASQTDLQAATNKTYKAMDSTFPSRSGQVMTWKSSFASGDANYVWAECALLNGNNPPTAKMLSRIAQAMGTKVAGTVWTLTYTVTAP